jgi:hypothetical protein
MRRSWPTDISLSIMAILDLLMLAGWIYQALH